LTSGGKPSPRSADKASEAEIVEAVNVIVVGIERQRGRIDDQVIDEMILMVKECVYATHETPGGQ
jgi:hypothetical protein